jgi:CRISPR-associated protein Cas2
MFIVCYDISSDKVRAKFAKFLRKYGRPLQYSIIEIKNSDRLLKIILSEIENTYSNQFGYSDSVLIFPVDKVAYNNMHRYGYPVQAEETVISIE